MVGVGLCIIRLVAATADPGNLQDPGGVAGEVAGGGCDVAGAADFQGAHGKVAQGCHGLRPVAGADLGGVFAVGDVANVVEDFGAPVAACPSGELVGVAGLAVGLVMA